MGASSSKPEETNMQTTTNNAQTTTNNAQTTTNNAQQTNANNAQQTTANNAQQTTSDNQTNATDSISTPDNYYENTTLLSFLCCIWSRLAYMDNTNFVNHYSAIFKGDHKINKTDTIDALFAKIKSDPSILQTSIPFIDLAQEVNKINGEQRRSDADNNCGYTAETAPIPNTLIFTSVATSNYSQTSIFGDTRMPNVIGVCFRGTYSIKSAGSYTQPASLFPKSIIAANTNIKVLDGIYKILIEVVHTILLAIEDVKTKLNPTGDIQLITTGHSLGGALATLFAYIYAKTQNKKITCMSIGAPRVFNKLGAADFCKMSTVDDNIKYKRIVSYNDPVPALPHKKMGFEHPCSEIVDTETKGGALNSNSAREQVSLDCLVQIDNSTSKRCAKTGRLAITPNYKLPLRCMKTKRTTNRFGISESPFLTPGAGAGVMAYHLMYMGILYGGGVSLSSFIKMPDMIKQSSVEINRLKNDTLCRVCFYNDGFKTSFFNLTQNRKQNGQYREDVGMNPAFFDLLKQGNDPPEGLISTTIVENPNKTDVPFLLPMPASAPLPADIETVLAPAVPVLDAAPAAGGTRKKRSKRRYRRTRRS